MGGTGLLKEKATRREKENKKGELAEFEDQCRSHRFSHKIDRELSFDLENTCDTLPIPKISIS